MMLRNIKTAPKDGTHIIGYGTHKNDFTDSVEGFCEVYWYNDLKRWYNIIGSISEIISWIPLPEKQLYDENKISVTFRGIECKPPGEFKKLYQQSSVLEAPPRKLVQGNVVYNSASNMKYTVTPDSRYISINEEFVCDKPHDDGDYSYMCGNEHCRCRS